MEDANPLEDIIQHCAKFGYELFSHPSHWRFTFQAQSSEGEYVVVVPGLEELGNRHGEPYYIPHLLLSPTIAYL